jgi:hypothetical protein
MSWQLEAPSVGEGAAKKVIYVVAFFKKNFIFTQKINNDSRSRSVQVQR